VHVYLYEYRAYQYSTVLKLFCLEKQSMSLCPVAEVSFRELFFGRTVTVVLAENLIFDLSLGGFISEHPQKYSIK